jgi:hypothetical protein
MGGWGRRGLSLPGQPTPGPAGSRRVGGRYVPARQQVWRRGAIRFKSRYEYNYSLFLDYVGLAWVYEPRKFLFERIQTGVRVYMPDFYLPEESRRRGHEVYHECKGYMDRRSRTQIARLRRYFPEVELVVIDAGFFRAVCTRGICRLVPGWSCPHTQPGAG